MNQFQQELQALSLNDYQSGNVVYWDQQNQYPYYYIEDAARRCGGCGRCGGLYGVAHLLRDARCHLEMVGDLDGVVAGSGCGKCACREFDVEFEVVGLDVNLRYADFGDCSDEVLYFL